MSSQRALSSNFGKLLQTFGRFVQLWLSTHWRSLLLLFLGVFLPLQLAILLAGQIQLQEGGLPWDVSILLAIHSTAQANLDSLALTLTQFGTRWGVFPVSTALVMAMFFLKRWRSLIYLLITLPGAMLINRTAKELLHRVRPHLWDSTFPPEPEFAFPSGHAMASMAFVASLVVLTWGSRWCGWVTTLGSLFVLAIAWTRLYLGVHYPSDIVAGWMVSIAWAIAVSLVVKPHLAKLNSETLSPENNEVSAAQE
ncbi:phosphatase PAP2 family protein [Trichocoleus sp. FACHB-262]|uniref:phosphatase PAP2 family protein n=1 Tax=Trichocoleus sp. FACHB-262 TaxID=2692869 RepID=UPI001684479B|nr:phosphatase PAP2 family protein [Trichocoleus sp. FACHB-262]MBD2120487.1 phosphatase PAP2 family protein [Trichocoleus sp. FACHB-262]